MSDLFKNSTGYKRLDAYILMNIVQLETLVFCRRFLSAKNDPCGRQFDQMTQAARSGVKNLTEGSERLATSAQTALKLIDVAKASLCELRDDYLTWILDKNLPPWRKDSPEAVAVYAIHLDHADYGEDVNHDLAVHIIAQRRRFAPWFGDGNREQSSAVESNRSANAIECDRLQSKTSADVVFANAMLILISRAIMMLDRILRRRGEEFVKEGGFSERMTAARIEEKRSFHRPVDDDAPKCPKCGADMRLRHGKSGDFWGCTGYPSCRGTKPVEG